jgi:Uma2 family endonuclease
MTAEQLAALPDDGRRYELVRGELHMMSPAGHEHGRVAMRLGSLLEQHVRRHQLGTVYAAETGFLIAREPDTVRAPDVAFVRAQRLAQLPDEDGYLPLAPDLVAEVVSPRDKFSEVEAKALAWLEAGTSLVLVVDPGTRTARVYRTKDNIAVLHEGETVSADDVVPGWEVAVADLFA